MRKIDFVKMGFKNLWRRKLRTILTIVGVIIGTFSIVIMMSLGIAMTEGYKSQLEEIGSLTRITIQRYGYYEGGGSEPKTLDDTLVETLKGMQHVRAVTPLLQISANLKSGKYQSYVGITGIDPDTIQYFDFPELASGSYLSADDPTALLFGADSCYFYNPKQTYYRPDSQPQIDLMNDRVDITFDNIWDSKTKPKYNKLKTAGVMVQSNNETSYTVYGNIEQVKKWQKEQGKNNTHTSSNSEFSYSSVWVSIDNVNNVKTVQDKIKEMGYSAYSLADSLESVKEVSNMLQLILGGIGAISLLVSAIGIANTMVMSIYERTKEIGIMKVLGCLVPDIRKLFLLEASIIGLLGGAFGIGFSYGISFILNKYAPEIGSKLGIYSGSDISVIPIWLALVAVAFAMLIGIVSGLYPAKRATKIKPLDAIRSET